MIKKKEPRGFGKDAYHKNGTPRVERYFVCSKCLCQESIVFRYMLPHSKEHKDKNYRFFCTVCRMQTPHHDIGHISLNGSA